ncbi:MAG: PEP-CTERM sorting domain-containing protein [Planctomycetales bacterium]|nr:PEP-CTERM sorting domain-containing protein [Planctomycetales bacterium]
MNGYRKLRWLTCWQACLLPCLLLTFAPVRAKAAVVTPNSVLGSSNWPGRPVTNLINGGGLTTTGDVLSWTHIATGGADEAWHAGPDSAGLPGGTVGNPPPVDSQELVFFLPGATDLTGAYFWQQPQGGRGLKDFEILTSTDFDLSTATFTSLGNFTLDIASSGALTTQERSFVANDVWLVKININTTHSGSVNDYVGLAEVRFEGVTPVVVPSAPTLTIDRDTGNMTLASLRPEDHNFIAYAINSPSGALNDSQWTPIADTGDGDSGGSLDSDVWIPFSAPGARSSLSEGELPGGDGLTLSSNSSIDLGNIWIKNPRQDVSIQLMKADGTFDSVLVQYTGNDGDAFVAGDMNLDGMITPADWPLFRAGFGGDYRSTALSAAETYALGDLDGDRDSDLQDFRLFEAAYDLANGGGALAALASVPEPASVLLLGLGAALAAGRRRVRSVASAAAVSTLACLASASHAQTFTVVAPPTDPTTQVSADVEFSGSFAASNLFSDTSLTAADINAKAYDNGDAQYAGRGNGPFYVFIDNGTSINANWIAFAERTGGIATADRVGQLDFWFSNTPFGGVVPTGAPAASVVIDDPLGTTLKPYPLQTEASGRYAVIKMTADPDLFNSASNIGGHEFRFLQGPSPLRLEVNTTTGAIKLKNDGASAQALTLDGYQISSEGSSLSTGWSGLGGQAGFAAGTGSGNGWEKGAASGPTLLTEAFLLGGTSVAANASISLGAGFVTGQAQDLEFAYSIDDKFSAKGIVTYVSTPGTGDFDGDGTADGGDFLAWQRNFGATSGAAQADGDGDGDGSVNSVDLALWNAQFGAAGLAATAAAVPEPGTAGLLLASVAALIASRRRQAAHNCQRIA